MSIVREVFVAAACLIAVTLLVPFGPRWNSVANPAKNVTITTKLGAEYTGTLHATYSRDMILVTEAGQRLYFPRERGNNAVAVIHYAGSNRGHGLLTNWRLILCWGLSLVLLFIPAARVFSR